MVQFLRGRLLFYTDSIFYSEAAICQYFRSRKRYMLDNYLVRMFELLTAWMEYMRVTRLLEKYVPLLKKDPHI